MSHCKKLCPEREFGLSYNINSNFIFATSYTGCTGQKDMDMREHWDLAKGDEKHDILPEIYLGKNVADFIDPDIMKVRFQLAVVV